MDNKYIPECLICFNNIHNPPYVCCNTCETYVHKKCYLEWTSFSKNKNNKCIHCQKNNSLIFYNETTFKRLCKCLFNF